MTASLTDYLISTTPTDHIGALKPTHLDPRQLNAEPPKNARAFFVDGSNLKKALAFCRVIRRHQSPAVYLRPIVLLTAPGNETAPLLGVLQKVADNQVAFQNLTAFHLEKIHESTARINERIRRLPEFSSASDIHIGLKIIRYLFTRETALEPERTAANVFGYQYLAVDLFLTRQDGTLFQILDFLESQRLVSRTFFEKAHFCIRCNCAFLNFTELCPQCGSGNIHAEDILHHFHCGYAGPASDFKKRGGHTCPKCSQELKNIGVDFDKPSVAFQCNNCSHHFQEPDVGSICFHCGQKADPEELILRTIHRYTLTALAENAALFGIDTLFRQAVEEKLEILPLDFFKFITDTEIARIQRYKKSESTLTLFQIQDMDTIYLDFGEQARRAFEELGMIFKSGMRKSDVVTTLNDATFLFLLTETPLSGAETLLRHLKEKISKLLESSLERAIRLKTRAMPLAGGQSATDLIAEVMQHDLDS